MHADAARPTAPGPDLLVVGDCNPDLVLRGAVRPHFGQREQVVDEAQLVIGGSAAITACGAARLGLSTALAACVGDDAFGQFMRRALGQAGVDVDPVRTDAQVPTGVTVNLAERDDRAILTYQGAMAAFTADHVDRAALRGAAHVHVCSVFLQPGLRAGLADLLAEARADGATTSLDPGWDPRERWEPLDDLLPVLDYLLPNAQEAAHLSGTDDPEAAAARLAERGPTVVVKLGAEGALASDGRAVHWVPAPAVDAVDGTGAGDTFAAAFIAMSLSGRDVADCLRAACAAGAMAAAAAGGTSGQPDMRALETALVHVGQAR